MIRETIKTLKKELDELTIKDLVENKDVKTDLREIVITIGDFLKLLAPWKRPFIVKISGEKQ